jgi:hypothetical protein
MRPRELGRTVGNAMKWVRHPPADPVAPWLAVWAQRHPVAYGLIVAILAGITLILAAVVVIGLVRVFIGLVVVIVHDPMRVLGPLTDLRIVATERIENFYRKLPSQIQPVVFWAAIIVGLLIGWGIVASFWDWMKRKLPFLSFCLLAGLGFAALYMAHEAGMPSHPDGWCGSVWRPLSSNRVRRFSVQQMRSGEQSEPRRSFGGDTRRCTVHATPPGSASLTSNGRNRSSVGCHRMTV